VIQFPTWRVYSFVDEHGRNLIRQWLLELNVAGSDRFALQLLIDICEHSGPRALSYCTEDLGNGFYALLSRRKGGPELSPVFCFGPFGETEITFLAGAVRKDKRLKPRYAAEVAEENLEVLLENPQRRRRERVT